MNANILQFKNNFEKTSNTIITRIHFVTFKKRYSRLMRLQLLGQLIIQIKSTDICLLFSS